MALTSERKISILIIGTFLVGMIIGLFFARIHEMRNTGERVTFTTQSIGGKDTSVLTKEVPCPWEQELRDGKEVILANPLEDKAGHIFSLQQGIFSENYTLRGPASDTKDFRKGQLIKRTIDTITAGMEEGNGLCVYSSLGTDVVSLRYDGLGDACKAVNTLSLKGFSCPVEG